MKYVPLPKIVARQKFDEARGSEKCEVEMFATGAVCGRPAEAVWVCGEMRKRICRRCSMAVTVCGGSLVKISP